MPAKASEKPKASRKDDPFDLQYRLEKVADWLLADWENNKDMKNRPDALKILQYGSMFTTRNSKLKDVADESNAGSAVKRYSGAFRTTKTADGGDRRPASGRSVPALIHSVATDPDDADDPEAA